VGPTAAADPARAALAREQLAAMRQWRGTASEQWLASVRRWHAAQTEHNSRRMERTARDLFPQAPRPPRP
jgi:hypothetical protein